MSEADNLCSLLVVGRSAIEFKRVEIHGDNHVGPKIENRCQVIFHVHLVKHQLLSGLEIEVHFGVPEVDDSCRIGAIKHRALGLYLQVALHCTRGIVPRTECQHEFAVDFLICTKGCIGPFGRVHVVSNRLLELVEDILAAVADFLAVDFNLTVELGCFVIGNGTKSP